MADCEDSPQVAELKPMMGVVDSIDAIDVHVQPTKLGQPADPESLCEQEQAEEPSSSGTPKPTALGNASAVEEVPKCCGIPLRWLSLTMLMIQSTGQVFLVKFARLQGTRYLNSSCILFAEILKLLMSLCLLSREMKSVSEAAQMVAGEFTTNLFETLKVAVPSLAYVIQNTLLFYSLDKLSMAVQQVTYQLKILAAALLGVVLMGRQLTLTKWASLGILVCGVGMVQYPRGASSKKQTTTTTTLLDVGTVASPVHSDALAGFLAVLAACFVSGFAGAYMEMILKKSEVSIWLRNVQLAFFGSFLGLASAFATDGDKIANDGLTQGFTLRTVAVVVALGCGGILVAVVLKYADNIARQFSTALSIILTSILSWLFFGEFEPDALFACGAGIAILATFMYSLGLPSVCVRGDNGM